MVLAFLKEVVESIGDFFSPFPKVKELVGDINEETVAAIAKMPFEVAPPTETTLSPTR